MVLALFYELILIKLYTNVNNDNILDKLAFQRCSSKPSSRSQLHMAGAFITFNDCLVFSSPEPKAPGELIGWEGSVVRRRRPSTISNDFSSETTRPIVTKFHM